MALYLILEPSRQAKNSGLSEGDFMWVEGGLMFQLDELGQLVRFSEPILIGHRVPLDALVADQQVRKELSVELLDTQLSEINPYFSQYHVTSESIRRQQSSLPRNAPERVELGLAMTELGTRFNDQVKSVLLDKQWREFESLAAMHLVFKHGFLKVIRHLAKRYAEERGLDIGNPLSESRYKQASAVLEEKMLQIEKRYLQQLKSVLADSWGDSSAESHHAAML